MPRSRRSTRRLVLALGLTMTCAAVISTAAGCTPRTESPRPQAATRPAPLLDAQAPEGLQTATFGLG